YLPQEPDLAGFATALAYVEAGFDASAADGHHRALYLLEELGLWPLGEGGKRFIRSGIIRSGLERGWPFAAKSDTSCARDGPHEVVATPGVEDPARWRIVEERGVELAIEILAREHREGGV